jgi:hypothetical protein
MGQFALVFRKKELNDVGGAFCQRRDLWRVICRRTLKSRWN